MFNLKNVVCPLLPPLVTLALFLLIINNYVHKKIKTSAHSNSAKSKKVL